jgi:hypothetical protein
MPSLWAISGHYKEKFWTALRFTLQLHGYRPHTWAVPMARDLEGTMEVCLSAHRLLRTQYLPQESVSCQKKKKKERKEIDARRDWELYASTNVSLGFTTGDKLI